MVCLDNLDPVVRGFRLILTNNKTDSRAGPKRKLFCNNFYNAMKYIEREGINFDSYLCLCEDVLVRKTRVITPKSGVIRNLILDAKDVYLLERLSEKMEITYNPGKVIVVWD